MSNVAQRIYKGHNIDKLIEAHRWRPYPDEKPEAEIGTYFLVWTGGGPSVRGWSESKWYYDVLYWMELPPNPVARYAERPL